MGSPGVPRTWSTPRESLRLMALSLSVIEYPQKTRSLCSACMKPVRCS